jgi:hypothetical protein
LNNILKKSARSILLILALSLTVASNANAGIINTGTLDVSPVNGGSSGWFTKYLAPGESSQEKIRISNFDDKAKDLEIYVSDAGTADTAAQSASAQPLFFAKSQTEKSDDIAGWIKLPTPELTLAQGESAILSVNFTTPKNAGVGLHTAAIIVREKTDTSYGQIAVEKGVRVYLNVTGTAIAGSEVTTASVLQKTDAVTLSITTTNTGTIDRLSSYGLSMEEIFGNSVLSSKTGTRIKPSTSATDEISVRKPAFGVYSIYATDGTDRTYMGTVVFIPLWALLLFLCATLLVTRPSFGFSVKSPQQAFKWGAQVTNGIFAQISRSSGAPTFRHALVYFGIFAVMAGSTLYLSTVSFESVGAQSMNPRPAHSYIFTVKWGNFRNLSIPASYTKNWEGNIRFENAKINILDYLHFEQSDRAEVVNDGTTLDFKNTTGPDNDGIVIRIEPTSDTIPTGTYTNAETGEQYSFLVTDFVDAPATYPSGLFAVHLKAELGPEHEVTGIAEELEATPEIEATPAVGATIPELENLFVQDLPATPEVLADFILKSSYVDEIVTERKTSQVKTDPILIEALSATPEILAEISASPDLNFIFVPNALIKFPPTEFSFEETKVTVEDLGSMVFVQNKGTPWNTYVGTTDFTPLFGKSTIPADSLTIIPGEPLILSGKDSAVIQPGNPRAFKGTADKSVLVNVDPGTSTRQIFIMNPQLQVRIPPGTLPGHYRGTLTITSL